MKNEPKKELTWDELPENFQEVIRIISIALDKVSDGHLHKFHSNMQNNYINRKLILPIFYANKC